MLIQIEPRVLQEMVLREALASEIAQKVRLVKLLCHRLVIGARTSLLVLTHVHLRADTELLALFLGFARYWLRDLAAADAGQHMIRTLHLLNANRVDTPTHRVLTALAFAARVHELDLLGDYLRGLHRAQVARGNRRAELG